MLHGFAHEKLFNLELKFLPSNRKVNPKLIGLFVGKILTFIFPVKLKPRKLYGQKYRFI